MVKCAICGVLRKQITAGHIRQHGLQTTKEYKKLYPKAPMLSQYTLERRRKSRGVTIDSPITNKSTEHDFHISKNRTRRRISYDEFLELLNQGYTLKQMKDEGISKHQVGFYSVLAQNKISITKQQFNEEYCSGKSLDEIAKQYNIYRDHVTQLRDYFGIKRKGPKFIHRKKTEKPLTFRQKKIVYGGLMGDASCMSSSSIRMKQSIKQKEYLLWKYNEMKEHVSPTSLQVTADWDKRYNRMQYNIRFYTYANSDIEHIVQKFYCSTRKSITDDILNHIDDLALAIWFMDDGSTDWYERSCWNNRPTCTFCTDSFGLIEVQLICEAFREMWDIESTQKCVGKQKDGELKYRPRLDPENTQRLFGIVGPYVIPEMRYKIDIEAYREWSQQQKTRKEAEETDRASLIRQELDTISKHIIERHPDQRDKLNVFANKHIGELYFKGN